MAVSYTLPTISNLEPNSIANQHTPISLLFIYVSFATLFFDAFKNTLYPSLRY
jgi:hypothetical protein